MEEIVPNPDTIAVPPAETKGWYPSPSLDPTDTIIPPIGKLEVFTSYKDETPVPTKLIVVIPALSDNVYPAVRPGDWNISFIKMIPLSAEIPVISDLFDFKVKSDLFALNLDEISSNI
jgi:hypothetical protein